MDVLVLLILGMLAGGLLVRAAGKRISRRRVMPPRPSSAQTPAADEIYAAAEPVYKYFQSTAHPGDLRKHPGFRAGVELLSQDRYSLESLLNYSSGDNPTISCMALEALAGRVPSETARAAILASLGKVSPWVFYFALNTLDALTPKLEPVVGPVILGLGDSWEFDPNRFCVQFLIDFSRSRARGGERMTFGSSLDQIKPGQIDAIRSILDRLDAEVADPLRSEVKESESSGVDTDFFEGLGRVWKPANETDRQRVLEHPLLVERADLLEQAFSQARRASAIVVGESGVGKTSLIRLVAERLARKGWTVFEAGHAELIAGQAYIGQFEERLQRLVRKLEGRRVLWVVPDLHSLLFVGRHRNSSVSALDFLMPSIESGRVCMIAEAQPKGFERLLQEKPRISSVFEVCRLGPTDEVATLQLAGRWVDANTGAGSPPVLESKVLKEAWHLTQQYLGHKAAPGNLLGLLESTHRRLAAGSEETVSMTTDDLVVTLSQITGLPVSILDDRQGLDLNALRNLFERRVIGQPEAVDCLVERVAMIKAGVCDPTRPFGVFLFAGPTGTGKTQMAKALAEFLFGSPERMLRLDMSELQTSESLSRVLGEPEREAAGGSLVDQIRNEPFSVVLLDEIEKAHPNVWDLFLQVFDDGRLTDRRGLTADFRHAIVIMTSNLGSGIASGPAPGFSRTAEPFSSDTVRRAIEKAFRKEFLNRIDRLVVFRPLSREVMRQLLQRELTEVFLRRGLRHREWAVTWSEDAAEFLLETGFSVDLGARPLKRAVERYLLTPLALATVRREVPGGDQLLYIRKKGNELAVEFVDADAPSEAEDTAGDEVMSAEARGGKLSLEDLILHPSGTPVEVDTLRDRLAILEEWLESDPWRQKKEIALSLTGLPDFWSSPSRFSILEQAERLDRIDAALRTARTLCERVRNASSASPERVAQFAQQLFLIEAGAADLEEDRPWDAFLMLEGSTDPANPRSAAFVAELSAMYGNWARLRGMRVKSLEESSGAAQKYLFAISGITAYRLLSSEDGLHVWESPGSRQTFERTQARVSVVPQAADGPLPPTQEHLAQRARDAFTSRGDSPVRVVRRYRREPSPLVRDGVLRWRTGRLDLVFGGNFDLMTPRSNLWLSSWMTRARR